MRGETLASGPGILGPSPGKAQAFRVATLPEDGQAGHKALSLQVPLLFLLHHFHV